MAGAVRNNLDLRSLHKAMRSHLPQAGAYLPTIVLLVTQLCYNDIFRAEAEDLISVCLSLPNKHWPVAWEPQTNSSEEDVHAML